MNKSKSRTPALDSLSPELQALIASQRADQAYDRANSVRAVQARREETDPEREVDLFMHTVNTRR